MIDDKPDPHAGQARAKHAADLASTIVERLNAEQDNFSIISDGGGLNTYVQLMPTATTIIESYLRDNL